MLSTAESVRLTPLEMERFASQIRTGIIEFVFRPPAELLRMQNADVISRLVVASDLVLVLRLGAAE